MKLLEETGETGETGEWQGGGDSSQNGQLWQHCM